MTIHRKVLAALTCSALILSTAAQAQLGGLLGSIPRDAVNDAKASDAGCAEGRKKSTAGKVLGGLLGRAAQNAASRSGVSSWVPVSEFSGELTAAIACRLDPEEQKQAAEATLQATRSIDDGTEALPPTVGDSAQWTSGTRKGVSGKSTVTGRIASAEGADCITVTDVIIVAGEETTADKRMCRPPGSRRYSVVA